MARSDRPAPPQHVLRVEAAQQLGPHLVRLTLTGPSIAGFPANGFTDSYVKLIFVDPALGLEPPYDVRVLRAELPADQQPVMRTYTVSSVDTAASRLTLDFVTHGDVGVAGPWAAQAAPGDVLVAAGPGGAYAPDAAAPFHLFIGDLSALPAIAAALAALPAGAAGMALVEITDPTDELTLPTPGDVQVHWLLNTDPGDSGFLARAVAAADWPAGTQVFAHGERESIKAVRTVLRERSVPRESLSISAYWARGRTEDAFQAEKREPIGKIE